jgi:peptidoglycan/xylan/chitin deacetylase (PgdA/CDA1 family)
MKNLFFPAILAIALLFSACTGAVQSNAVKNDLIDSGSDASASTLDEGEKKPVDEGKKEATAAEVLSKKEVPVLCYHQIRELKASDSKRAHDDIMPPAKFAEHMKMLADSGYQTISPNQLYDYLNHNAPLPKKPIVISFDDNNLDQYTVGAKVLNKYGFKGVFFIMTVTIGRPRYMNKAQLKELSDDGHVIASHTYDHKNFAQFTDEDWEVQIDKPNRVLESITGKKVEYLAYPYGVFKASSLPKLKEHGMKGAFILSTKRDENYPLYTIRRIIDPSNYTAKNLYNSINKSFK